MMKMIEGGILAPKGFKATGGHVGLKKEKKDLCLILSETDAEMAGCFTQNIVKAAPVLWDMQVAASGQKVRGFVVNSGNANACTGQQGIDDNFAMVRTYADCVGATPEQILCCSTGVIGVPLPIDKVTSGIKALAPKLDSGHESGTLAAEAIMTTDTFAKTISVEIRCGGKAVRIGGMAKGSGMIHPNMATMLAFVTTDAAISRPLLEKALKESTEDTYNMISVDGDTSTNDAVMVLANGMAGNPLIDTENADYETFKAALHYVNRRLAVMIAKDGEGATKLIEVAVSGAKTKEDARKIAKAVVASSLFKAALFGADANWGRVLCAMGYSEGAFDPDQVTIVFKSLNDDDFFDKITLMDKSVPIIFNETEAKKILDRNEIFVDILLFDGQAEATAWGCDLTYDYVKINGDYRT